jgi:hypothetical protein
MTKNLGMVRDIFNANVLFDDVPVASDRDCPPMVLWLAKRYRRTSGEKSKGMTYPHSFHIAPEHLGWCCDNLADGFKVVRVFWVGGGRNCYRYGLQFASERDMVLYKIFHDPPA